ncbi:sigma-54-dependent transcriptional regulator [Paramaledivibacter caminithermalis]|uniref:Stage 0 sporulation protein A homolog n=1 Tax=Paramaledivibacter caminithermalis (strain DSM 15212 / CIP 107654 / DViRD3) TaxID=1121301 RepID=A0A1M6MX68_PARC5|nr:sigma-54 dependent transcriptional regulator [Paramaledivibacter caminithermalis]SHJ88065.1 two-component system, NtrC family, response regulator AtoC [Paramaledivibacter caminithermalis DSM 15212]
MYMRKKILVADDEGIILKIINEELINEGYEVDTASDGEEASIKIKQKKYDLVILDNKMPKKSGIEVLKEIKDNRPNIVVIMMTAFGTINNAVEAMKLGAYDYITKPFENNDLIYKVKQAFKVKESIIYKADSREEEPQLVGSSKEILEIKRKIEKIKDLDTTVLLTGESGTGKGVIAREIHNLSNRSKAPFIHVNCAVLPANLIESELFGHEKGAFTGANESKQGKFELALNGTIFLDEIGTLDHSLQAKLLTVLQEKKFEKIGASKTIPLRARIIAATNDNLEEAVKYRRFREDLYYRLNVISIECPPLRFRKEDIEKLALYFVKKMNTRLGKNIEKISPEVWEIFMNYNWPGNIRELENTVESSIALSNGKILLAEDLPLRIRKKVGSLDEPTKEDGHSILEIEEIKVIKKALERNNGHRQRTAKDLGISRRTLQYKLKKFGLL